MEKHIIDIFVPHKKLRKVYYLVSALLLLLWIPDLSKLNIPLPSKVLETWFLDKLLLTTIVLLTLYAFSAYFLSFIKDNASTLTQPAPPQTKEIPQEQEIISEMHERILESLFQKSAGVEDICKAFKLHREESNYYLHDLYNKEMAYPPVAYSSGKQEWTISQYGREYIMKKRAMA